MEVAENVSSFPDFLAIILSQEALLSGKNPERVAHIEPLPRIDYNFLYNLISLRRGISDIREWKRYDYLIQARKEYYKAHGEFQLAFHAFEDVHTYDVILDQEKANLEALRTATAKQWERHESARRKNIRDLKRAYENMVIARTKRDLVTQEFSRMKIIFLKTELPWLLENAKHIYQYTRSTQGQQPTHQYQFNQPTIQSNPPGAPTPNSLPHHQPYHNLPPTPLTLQPPPPNTIKRPSTQPPSNHTKPARSANTDRSGDTIMG